MRLDAALIGAYPAEVPDPIDSHKLSVARLLKREPSPLKLTAVTIPATLTLPSILSLYQLAVVPIPTPVPSTANSEVPDPTFKVFKPGDVVPIPN